MSFPSYPRYKESGVPWLGTVPAHWDTLQLRHLAHVEGGSTPSSDEIVDPIEGDHLWATPADMEGWLSDIGSTSRAITEAGLREIGGFLAKPGDVLFSCRAPVGKVALVKADMAFNQGCKALVPRGGVNAGYLAYQIDATRIAFDLAARGTTFSEVSAGGMRAVTLARPPEQEQRHITAFLDRETAKIGSLIAEQKGILDLLVEKQQAAISTSVTKGLNPSLPMADTNVPWLGKVPAHWELRAARRLLQEVVELSATGDEELLSVSHLTGVTKRSEKSVNMFEAFDKTGYKIVRPEQLVVNTMWAWMGAMGIAADHGIVSPAYNIYRCRPDGLAPAYVGFLVKSASFVKEVTRFSKGIWSSRLRLYPEELFKIVLPVPPKGEQQAIVEHLRALSSQHMALAREAERSITLLQERRAALILAAVTGRIDVREAALASGDERAAA